MTINGAPVVAKAGRTASNISRSGFRLVSSARQNATSSAITPTAVTPRMVRNDAGRHSMSTPLLRLIVSAVAPMTSTFSAGTVEKMPSRYWKAFPACQRLADRIGSVARSPGARTSK